MKKILNVLQIFLLIIIIISVIKIYNYNLNLKETDNIQKTTKVLWEEKKAKENNNETNDVSDNSVNLVNQNFNQDFLTELEMIYPDIVSYININNTAISYPIMQTDNNDYYLNHSSTKEYNENGSIFMSYLNNPDFSDDNTVIYGHNVKSGKMFQNLHLLKKQDFFNNSHIIDIETYEGSKQYFIFSIYKTNPDYQYKTPNYETTKEKHLFIGEILKRNIVSLENLVDYDYLAHLLSEDDVKLITLSTCEVGGKERLVVHGVEIK